MKTPAPSNLSSPAQPLVPLRRVLIFSGHMVDAPDRPVPRFPAAREASVRSRLARQITARGVGSGDLAITGAARGGDLLFAEICADLGAEVWLFLPLPVEEFLDASVRLPHGDWEARFHAIRQRPRVRIFLQHEHLGPLSDDLDVHARNNLWIIETARLLAPGRILAFMIWDGKSDGDGPGGTADFAGRVKQLGGELASPIDPLSSAPS